MKEIAFVSKSGKLISDGPEETLVYDRFTQDSSGSAAVILDDIPRAVYYADAGSEYELYSELG